MSNPFEISRVSHDESQDGKTESRLREPSKATAPPSNYVLDQISVRRKEEEQRPKEPTKGDRLTDFQRKMNRVQSEALRSQWEGRYIIPDSVVTDSEKVLEARTDAQKKELTADQSKLVRGVEHAVLKGDLYSLRTAVISGKPEQGVIDTISKDLDSIGMKFEWHKENIKIDSEKNQAYPGLRLTVGAKCKSSSGSLGPAESGPEVTTSLAKPSPGNSLSAVHLEMHLERLDFPIPNGAASVLQEIGITANARLSRKKPN